MTNKPTLGLLAEIAIDDIEPWTGNPRRAIDFTELETLAESIRQHGVISPITIRTNPNQAPPWLIVAGERRWRAALAAGLEFIPAITHQDLDDVTALEIALDENLKRFDINPLEEADALHRLVDAGQTQSTIAARLGLSQPWIANRLRLRLLSPTTRELIASGKLSAAHGIALASYSGLPLESWLATHAVRGNLSAHDLEKEKVNRLLYQAPNEVTTNLHEHNVGAKQLEICKKKCPFAAYRYANGTPHCLQPAHEKEMAANYDAASKAARATAIAKATETTGQAPKRLTDERDNLTQIWQAPPGCTADCPCRTKALDYQGQLADACSNPARLEQLRQEDREVELTKAKARRDAYLERVDYWVGRGMAHETEIIALLLVDRSQIIDDYLATAAQELGIQIKWKPPKSYGIHEDLLAELGKLDRNTLLALAGRATLRSQSAAAQQWAKLHRAPGDPAP